MSVKAIALVACAAATAGADPTDRCIADSETGQRLVLTRHFVEARDHLVACGRAECPAAVSRDCIDRLHQAEASMGSVVLVALLADGSAVGDARAFVDEHPASLGEAQWLDPGAHRVRFEHAGESVVIDAIVTEGTRLQRITGTLAAEPARSHGPIIAGASGVAVLAAAAVLGLVARSHHNSELAECASPTDCADRAAAQRDYDAATSYATASTITFVAGAAIVAAAAAWWVAARPHDTIIPTAGAHEVGLTYLRAF
jgi:hypothetical protein